MKMSSSKNISFLLLISVLSGVLASCSLSSKNKVSFNMNTKDAIALGAANVKSGRSVSPNLIYLARDAENDDPEELKLELKKITTDGSSPVFHFENANTSLFNIVNVLQDPYGASSDTYVILDHCALVYADENSNDDTEIPFGQILAIHDDGTYTDVIGYKKGENFAQWIVTYGNEPIWSNIIFDKDGNLYFIYYKPDEKDEEPDHVDLYKYNPQTRITTKLTDVNHTQIDRSVMVSEVEYIISEDTHWAFVKMQANNGEVALCAIDLTDGNKTTQLFYSEEEVFMSFAYDNINQVVYYQLQNGDCPLYKIPMIDGGFDSSEKELFLTNLISTKIQCTDSGLWSYDSFVGFQQITDSDGNLVNNIYSEYRTDDLDEEYQISLRYKFINNYLFRTSNSDFVCFDTISKSAVDLFKNVPDTENLKILSFGLSDNSIIYSAFNTVTEKNINGIIELEGLTSKFLNAEDSFSSLVIVDESKIE